MSAIQVPLYRLKILSNYRQAYDPDLLQSIADSYKTNGFKAEYPISVYPDGSDYIIIAGHTRYNAGLLYLEQTHDSDFMVWIVVNPVPSAAQFKLQQLQENSQRSDPDDISKALGYKQAKGSQPWYWIRISCGIVKPSPQANACTSAMTRSQVKLPVMTTFTIKPTISGLYPTSQVPR